MMGGHSAQSAAAQPKRANGLARFIPILGWLPAYKSEWLRGDVIAGLTVTAVLVPESMAYAQLAGMPPQAAFYAAPVALVLYAVFGSSRQLIAGVSSAVAVMSVSTIGAYATQGSPRFEVLTAL